MPRTGYKQTAGHRKKVSKALLGMKHSEETKKKLSEIHTGESNPAKRPEQRERMRKQNPMFKSEIRTRHSIFMTGDNNPAKGEEARRKNREAHLGIKRPGQSKRMLGCRNPNWQGGISSLNDQIRSSEEYKAWRLVVFERDGYTCQECNKKGVFLHAHHIKPFALFLELRFKVDNGITLCRRCHATKPKGREVFKLFGGGNAYSSA